MRIKHLKNQFRSFTLSSGNSLYLYPLAKNIEISEQDFYLSKKFQRYMKDHNVIEIEKYEEQEVSKKQIKVSGYSSEQAKEEKPKKAKKLKAKKYLEEKIDGSTQS